MTRFEGWSALITAGGSGLGRGVALRLAREGASVTILDRDETALFDTTKDAQADGLRLTTRALDMTDADEIRKAVAEMAVRAGRIDILFNNIGGSLHTPFKFLDQTDEHRERVMAVNVTACVRITRAVRRCAHPTASLARSGESGADTTAETAPKRNLSGHFLRKYPAGQWRHCLKLLGQILMARDFGRQVVERQVGAAMLNGCTALGIPVTVPVGQVRPGKEEIRATQSLRNKAPAT